MYLRPQKHCRLAQFPLSLCSPPADHPKSDARALAEPHERTVPEKDQHKPPQQTYEWTSRAHTHAVYQHSIAGTLVALRAENLKCVFAATSNPPSHKHARSCFLRWGLVCTALQRRWTGWRGGRAHERKSALTKCFRSRVGCAHTQSCALHSP